MKNRFGSYFTLLLLQSYILSWSHVALGQILINGQVYTNGLAIVDAPNPRSQFTAGQNLPIALDLSGDGRLSQPAFLPNSTLNTMYQSLNLFLVSSETNLNVTVSEGSQYLTQEPGSTVKHLTYVISPCVSAGPYNLTVYEMARINSTEYYSITPVPITIISNSPKSSCNSSISNPLQPQPQKFSPPPTQPWLGQYPITLTMPVTETVTDTETVSGAATTVTSVATSVVTSTYEPIATEALIPVNGIVKGRDANWLLSIALGLFLSIWQFSL